MDHVIVMEEQKINGNLVTIREYEDKNENPYYGITVLVPRQLTSFEIFNGKKATTRCSFLLSGDAYDFFMEALESLGDKLRFATGTVYLREASEWIDESGKEASNDLQSYCIPATKSLYQEGWFNKSLEMSQDAISAMTWLKSDEFTWTREEETEEVAELVSETATAKATEKEDLPF